MTSLVPWLEKANIKWKVGEAYDDYDNIITVLYYNIICTSLYGNVLPEYPIAKYDFLYDDYSEVDCIIVKNEKYAYNNLIFIAFESISSPLDTIKVAVVDKFGKVIKFLNIEPEGSSFLFSKRQGPGNKLISNIEVEI